MGFIHKALYISGLKCWVFVAVFQAVAFISVRTVGIMLSVINIYHIIYSILKFISRNCRQQQIHKWTMVHDRQKLVEK